MKKVLWSIVIVLAVLLPVGCTLIGGQTQNIDSTIAALEATQAYHMEIISYQATQIGESRTLNNYQATQIGENRMLISTLQAGAGNEEQTGLPRPTEYASDDITGLVLIEGGSCCVGGTAGETIQVTVHFEASSPNGEVVEMRVLEGGFSPSTEEMANVPWQPFQSEQTYDVYVVINWTGYWISVQFLDETGGVSQIFTDDISVEGAPESPGG